VHLQIFSFSERVIEKTTPSFCKGLRLVVGGDHQEITRLIFGDGFDPAFFPGA